jgi:hypothetical protein
VPFADQIGDALGQHRRLPSAGAGNYQHWAVHVLNGLPLPFIGNNFRRW